MVLTDLTNTLLPRRSDRSWYHEHDRHSDRLLICVGDSWTWGDSLGRTNYYFDDVEHRTTHVYGSVLSQMLDSDFINIGLPGDSNLTILSYLQTTINSVVKKYQRIDVVFTLTETGRELASGFLKQRDHYTQVWQGPDWPTFDDIITGEPNLDQVFDEIQGLEFEHHLKLYLSLRGCDSLSNIFQAYEAYTFSVLETYFKSLSIPVHWHIGRNFTSVCDSNRYLVQGLLEHRWVDVIAQRGDLAPYPDVYVLSGMGLDPLIEFTQGKFKQQWIDVLDQSSRAIDWLHSSPYNSKQATKHPLEQAHAWWAEYLYESIA